MSVQHSDSETDTVVNLSEKRKAYYRILKKNSKRQKIEDTELKLNNVNARSAKVKKKRHFDWSVATFGQFLLKIAYIGSRYSGLAWQPLHGSSTQRTAIPTVESKIFEALKKTCLVQNRKSCRFSRCGRTDKGVHAAGNYISVSLRLKAESENKVLEDYDYSAILNSVLPADIRVIDCKRVPDHFDARFQCLYRVYKYVFLENGMDVELMVSAAQKYVGEHDFRNFCKIDAERVRHFRRKILWVKFRRLSSLVWEIEIAGLSFLWHQIRCMMSVLFLIGRRLEHADVIDKMLDVEATARKPVYELADDAGLILYDCYFEGLHFHRNDEQELRLQSFTNMYREHVQATAVYSCLSLNDPVADPDSNIVCDVSHSTLWRPFAPIRAPSKYTPLLERPTAMSLEERKEAIYKKQFSYPKTI